jgi:sec-independent protein translocase protein TatC
MAKSKKSHDPVNCVMSLGDHLEELRARLILAVAGLALGAIVSMFFGTPILNFIKMPYVSAMRDRLQKTEMPQMESEALGLVHLFFDDLTSTLANDPNAPKIDPNRVKFLRKVSTQAVQEWVQELRGTGAGKLLPRDLWLTTLAPADAFTAYMKVSFIAGLILTAPWVFYQLWMFVAAGLYPKERNYVYKSVPFSAGLFIVGALFFLFVIAPFTLKFFLTFGDVVGVSSSWTLQKYISFVCALMLVFGLAFQTPIAVFILVRTGLVSLKTLRGARKYVVLGLAFVSAVATPPDVISMLALLIPLYCLFEAGIVLSIFAERKAKRKKAEAEAAQT